MSTLNQKLSIIVGSEFVNTDSKSISSCFFKPPNDADLRIVYPDSVEALQKILKIVNEEHLLLLTSYDQKISPSVNVNKKGLIINFSRMNKIERIDTKNLIVHIQRGVTFEQIIPELKKVGVKLNVPACTIAGYLSHC